MKIFVVIPAFNEEKMIKNVVKELLIHVKNIVVVNDSSTDNTVRILKSLPIKLITNTTNIGYTKSLEKGISYAVNVGADYVITFDADGQHIAEDVAKFTEIIEKFKPDLILGVRSDYNRFMEHIWSYYTRFKYGFTDPLCGLKAYKRNILLKYPVLEKHYTIGTEIIFKALKDGASFKEVPVKIKKRSTVSRFGNQFVGNWLEFKGLVSVIVST
ncbi:hypothetical protein A3A93_02755 [Candidatus Roizmanbacteria bacterium RIFCSPLOWO2_01_FULL_38_12]|uniref:Glycosyltransferase 2-like domain-containing protein n=1 Tax=Candidatus Roizmanbacteria bacterium RIFCSPLOWO2_01_FULL_38_12 TaxID=1802061 RepID=A0A1F7IUH4_9BACT|nr:MAG: hypothetical protein A2861_01830 [Candidatus Roizmanbacteria bacterium RIFCSPHIGHO2_01_FULL_38_15]OGK34340.1 MAG: hypothetical protein A3F59_04850 [Candidatus Roizmanbacteria bacterium RIFCSPHIGHO2_12_FULL_38_13]OGK47017.1 MAG: hypothetical protein A3A93_02755 [Candidatus Roizmanbacteria bacterium RIFCSPLOWO2_01_FULL_38_12]